MRLAIEVEAADPYALDEFTAPYAPDLDPAFGPQSAPPLDVYTYAPSTGGYLADILVEALDRSTGQPLSPAVTTRSDDRYFMARLTLPGGTSEVGLRFTHSDNTSAAPTACPVRKCWRQCTPPPPFPITSGESA
ncbi:MAG: hypothetical protein ABIJ09_26145 [Pseudomonadota bacterium]